MADDAMNWRGLMSEERRATAGSSLLEIASIWLLSNVPIAILVFIKVATAKGNDPSFSDIVGVVTRQTEPAEVFVYLCVILAPVLWMMIVNWRARTHYKLFVFLLIVQIVILVLTGIVYALYKTGAGLNESFIEYFASLSYTAVVGVWFATVYFRRAILETLTLTSSSKTASGLAQRLKERDHAT